MAKIAMPTPSFQWRFDLKFDRSLIARILTGQVCRLRRIAMKLYRMVSLSLVGMTVVMAFVMVAPVASSAQDATGRIYGTVYDQQGAVIPQAQISVTNTA